MNSLAGLFARVPRPVLFALAGLIQLGLIAAMVVDRASILREGTEVTLQTRPVDPRDFLRGDYVVLSYDISSVPTGELKGKLRKSPRPRCSSSSPRRMTVSMAWCRCISIAFRSPARRS